ncbi:hypothetical protein ACKWTF_002672 [Chironomus riparius]
MALCYIVRVRKTLPNGTKTKMARDDFDICTLDNTLVLLQQGFNITVEYYLQVSQNDGILKYLLWMIATIPILHKTSEQLSLENAYLRKKDEINFFMRFQVQLFVDIRMYFRQ